MAHPPSRTVEHETTIDAPAAEVYARIADVTRWPELFPPTVLAERLESDGDGERIRLWATANGKAKTWTSRRTLKPDALTVGFRQEVSQSPVGEMGGSWIIEADGPGRCRVRLLHDYRADEDDDEKLAWIEAAVDRNSRSELAALKAATEGPGDDLLITFDDAVFVDGSAKDVYDFLNEAGRWAERLPHVRRVALTEETEGLQVLEMETLTKDGSAHTTSSVRVCQPYRRIAYKQTVLPALMTLHTGQWILEETGSGVAVTSRHTVVINEANIAAVLGPKAGVAEAKQFVRTALSGNSRVTLEHAKRYAEG